MNQQKENLIDVWKVVLAKPKLWGLFGEDWLSSALPSYHGYSITYNNLFGHNYGKVGRIFVFQSKRFAVNYVTRLSKSSLGRDKLYRVVRSTTEVNELREITHAPMSFDAQVLEDFWHFFLFKQTGLRSLELGKVPNGTRICNFLTTHESVVTVLNGSIQAR